MIQENKKLLLKDLLPRQLYGVKAHYQYYDFVGGSERLIQEDDGVIESIDLSLGNPIYIDGHHVELENIKPYLRPMSSMTDMEKIELCVRGYAPDYVSESLAEKLYVIRTNAENAADFYNEYHFDYRGLIEKGLALEAPEGMYEKI